MGLIKFFNYPLFFLKGRLFSGKEGEVTDVKKNEGRLIVQNGKKVAVYRDKKGRLIKLSPVCSHLGCIVEWNQQEKTWDCPCHGSRFHADGSLLTGPATRALNKIAEK